MKGIVIFTAVVTVISAQVVFPGGDESRGGNSNSNNAESQVIAALFSSDRNFFSQQPTNQDSCSLPDGSIGSCVRFSQCSAYSNLVVNLNNPSILNFLRERVCRLLTNVVNVCCPVNEPGATPQNAINQPTRRPPQSPSILPPVPSGSQNPLFPSNCGQSFADRIIQGTEVVVGAYPWLVAIGRPSLGVFDVNCGGTLITRRHVLTAAHCFARFFKPTHVRVGEHDVTSDNDGANPQTRVISRIILSDYNESTNQNDIALLTLDRDVSFNSNIQAICLPFRADLRDNNFVGSRLDVVGWGRTNHSIRETSPIPLETKVEVVTSQRCQQAYRSLQLTITGSQVCAGTGGADSCNGDSGGPLHYRDLQSGRYYLAGVTSFGVECGRPDFPGVYTRVGSFLNWIEVNVN